MRLSILIPTLFVVLFSSPHIQAAGWKEMIYGDFFSATYLTNFPTNNTVLKGVAVRLPGKNGEDNSIIFDTEMMRYAAGAEKGFINMRGVVFEGGHGANPSIGGKQVFGSSYSPGWAKGTDLKDPRPIPHGSLPHNWARYRGFYRHPNGTTFLYTVGDVQILDQPGVETVDADKFFTRTLNIKPHPESLTMVVIDLDGAEGKTDGKVASLKNAKILNLVSVVGESAGAKLELLNKNKVVLKIPASEKESQIRVAIWGGGISKETPTVEKFDGSPVVKAMAKISKAIDLTPFTHSGPAKWTQTVTTKGELAAEKQSPAQAAYVLDSITPPFENPYNSWMRIGAFDLFSDGRAAVSTWSGDVWVVSGMDAKLDKLVWKRYATGIFHALGLKIVKDQVYVLGRDQITKLHDLNNDGEADFYECFNNDVMITQNFHEFTFDLQTGPDGSFYFIKGGPVRPGGSGWDKITPHHGCIFKVTPDGEKLEVVARGFRAPNGMGVGPKGEITTGDNEGTWTPAVPINWIKPNHFYGVPDFAAMNPMPKIRENPICWMPKSVDNSNGGQVWIDSDQFGPLSHQLLHTSYGTCTLFLVMKEEVDGQMQGGVVPIPVKFDSGTCRVRFSKVQNALFISGLKGWQTTATKDGGFYRLRYTGKPAYMPIDLHVVPNEIKITFTDALDKKSAESVDSYTVKQWNYRWTQNYGSPHFKVSNPKQQGEDEVDVESATLSSDGKTVTLKIDNLHPVMQMRIDMKLKTADGIEIKKTIHNTINQLGKEKGVVTPGEYKISK